MSSLSSQAILFENPFPRKGVHPLTLLLARLCKAKTMSRHGESLLCWYGARIQKTIRAPSAGLYHSIQGFPLSCYFQLSHSPWGRLFRSFLLPRHMTLAWSLRPHHPIEPASNSKSSRAPSVGPPAQIDSAASLLPWWALHCYNLLSSPGRLLTSVVALLRACESYPAWIIWVSECLASGMK